VPTGWKIDAGQGTASIKVTAGAASGNIKVSAKNQCGAGIASTLAVTSASVPAPAPSAIFGDTQVLVCSNQENLNYVIEPVPDAVYYIWEIIHDNSGWEITAGQGTISIQVKAGTQLGTITVRAVNGCGSSGTASVVVNPSSAASVAIGAITGSANTCSDQSGLVYSVPEVGGATNYTWTVPAGWKITAGANTPVITVTAGKTAGEISVVASNTCASSVASKVLVSVNPASPAPARIKELSSPCAGLVYAVDPMAGATGYIWTVPAGWTIKEGQGTTQIKVLATAGSKEGVVTVAAQTTACTSASTALLANATLGQADLTVSNVFSPNGDGVNDAWNISNIQNYPENELVVINRWGSEVYRAKAYQNNWNGGQLTAGTYYYVLKVKLCEGYQTQKGYVMIMR
jgi:gliding motility-associated-like protein